MDAPFPDKKAPLPTAGTAALARHEDSITESNQTQDRQRASRLLVAALGLLGEALDSAWHGDTEGVGLRAIRHAQTATHCAIQFMEDKAHE